MRRRFIYIAVFLLTGISFMIAAQDSLSLYQVSTPGWRSAAYSEITPALLKDRIVYLVDRNNTGKKSIRRNSSREMERAVNILYAVDKKDGKLEGREYDYAPELATASDRNGLCFNKQGTRMYLGKSRIENARRPNETGYGIFESVLQNGRWSDPVEIAALADQKSANSNTSHPALSQDGRRIYFSSNRQGGLGGYDIWYSDSKGGQWQAPVNMGAPVNTENDEAYPVVNPDGRLYFSSNNSARTGVNNRKLDIFYTEIINGNWIVPVRLGTPFNTQRFDDFHLILTDASFNSGYFCSDRETRKKSDIFAFRVNFPEFPEEKPVEELSLCFLFEESEGIQIDTNLTMWQWEFDDMEKVRALTAVHCFPGVGEYSVKLNIYDKLTKTITGNQTTYTLRIDSIEQPYFSCSDTIRVNEVVSFSGAPSYTPNLLTRNFYWKFRKTDDVKEKDAVVDSGEDVLYRFKSPGKYRILLGIKGVPVDPSYTDRLASYREIVVVR
ncbi:MAG: hypothetical protein U0T82_09465 [Bacteroidales bacterium]